MNRDNDKSMAQLKATIQRATIEKEQQEMTATTQQEVAVVKAEQDKSVLITEVQGEKNITENKVKAQVVEKVTDEKTLAQIEMKKVDQQAQVMYIDAQSEFDAAKSKQVATLEEGKAESKNLDAFEAQRRHQYELHRARVFETLALSQKNIVFSGKSGEAMLQALLDNGEKKQAKQQ